MSRTNVDKLILGDCLEELKKLPDKSVDIAITSPPYNLGNSHHTGTRRTQAYADDLSEHQYQESQLELLAELHRVVKENGSLFYNHKNRIKNGRSITPYEWLLKSPWLMKQEVVWFNGSQNFDKMRFYPMTERVYWLAKLPSTKLFNAINHHDFFSKSDWPAVGSRGAHTRAFPIQMPLDILKCFPDAQIVLDPFLGSGTTAVAAKMLGRHYIGIEREPEYLEIARKRLEGTVPCITGQETLLS